MEKKHHHHHHCVHLALSIAKVALQAATLTAVAVGVHKVDKIHRRLKKLSKEEHHHKLL